MKTNIKQLIIIAATAVLLSFGIISSAGAWVFVPSYGSSGLQTFEYVFTAPFDGTVGFVVSNQYDSIGYSELIIDLGGGEIALSTEWGDDTSAFLNALGQPGTTGEIYEAPLSFGDNGGTFSFNWIFNTNDYSAGTWGFHDFSSLYFQNVTGAVVYEEGLAQIEPVPEPATMLLFGTGLFGLMVLRRRFNK